MFPWGGVCSRTGGLGRPTTKSAGGRGRTTASPFGYCRFVFSVFLGLFSGGPSGGLRAGASPAPGIWRIVLPEGGFSLGAFFWGFFWQPFLSSEMEVALELREAVVSAVCAKEYDRLPGLIQRFAKLAPTEEILLRSGIGHLVGDRHLWALAGVTTQRRAAALQARCAKQSGRHGRLVRRPRGPRRNQLLVCVRRTFWPW